MRTQEEGLEVETDAAIKPKSGLCAQFQLHTNRTPMPEMSGFVAA